MTIPEALDAAADTITGAWTQGAWARDASGIVCPVKSPRARCWCADGAILRASAALWHDAVEYLEGKGIVVISFNDAPDQTEANIIAMLRWAAREYAA